MHVLHEFSPFPMFCFLKSDYSNIVVHLIRAKLVYLCRIFQSVSSQKAEKVKNVHLPRNNLYELSAVVEGALGVREVSVREDSLAGRKARRIDVQGRELKRNTVVRWISLPDAS